MDALNALLANDATLLFIGVIGIATCLLAYGISILVSGATDPVRRRLAEATISNTAPTKPSRSFDFTRIVDPVAKYILPKKSDERESTLKRLVQAGYRSPKALRQFYGIKAALAILFPVSLLIAVRWMPNLSSNMVLFLTALAAFIGVQFPDYVLVKLRERRIKRLRNGFPDALDLLVVCVESGLGLTQAIDRVGREIDISHGELAQEFALVNAEIRAGVERPAALRNLASRTGVDDINGLVGLLIQTIRFGTGIADALRVYSEEFRDKRMQKAEEQAAKIGTKMIFPLVFCFFPSFFIVAIGPAVMRIVWAFQQM
jgi:tight adherence protein C